jgi:biofilm PGA synthesis N-glycosyltransferase PgaC
LIGSDGSTDKTDEICAEFGDEIVFKRIEPRQGKANVLNTLVPLTKGDIIFFSDANTIIEPDALKKMVRHFGNDSIGGVCGRLVLDVSVGNLVSLESRYWRFESGLKAVESQVYSIIGSNGAIYSIRKELFQPFPKDIIIDDFWISLGILEQGKRVFFEVDAVGREHVSMNIVDEFWRKVRIGGGNMQAFSRKPFIRGKTWLLTNFMFYSHKVIRWAIPLMLVAMYIGILLLSEQPPFDIYLRVCNLFILIGMLGVLLEEKITIINAITYFLLFNFALLLGYIRYLMKRQSVIWKSAQRRISQG